MQLTATYQGQTFTRNTKAAYTHITIVRHHRTGELVDARWSKSAEAAAKPLPNGWEANRVAVIEVGSDDTVAEVQAPGFFIFPEDQGYTLVLPNGWATFCETEDEAKGLIAELS